MTTITLNSVATQSYRLKPSAVDKDGLIEITTGASTTATILAPLNWVIDGQTTAILQPGKSVTLKSSPKINSFQIISGYFLATTPLKTNTIPYGNVTNAPKFYATAVPVNLIVGNNLIEHNMGVKAVSVSCVQNGSSIAVTWNYNPPAVTDDLNFVNIPIVGKPVNGVSIFILGF